MNTCHLREWVPAQDGLAAGQVVFGPALDGGYYLVGVCQPPGRLFEVSYSLNQCYPFCYCCKTCMCSEMEAFRSELTLL